MNAHRLIVVKEITHTHNRRSNFLIYLEPSVEFVDGVCELDVLSFLEQRPQRRSVVEADVVPGERPVDAVASPLLLVEHQAGRWTFNISPILYISTILY